MQLSPTEHDDFFDFSDLESVDNKNNKEIIMQLHLKTMEALQCWVNGLCLHCKIELNDNTHSTSSFVQICDCCFYEMTKEY